MRSPNCLKQSFETFSRDCHFIAVLYLVLFGLHRWFPFPRTHSLAAATFLTKQVLSHHAGSSFTTRRVLLPRGEFFHHAGSSFTTRPFSRRGLSHHAAFLTTQSFSPRGPLSPLRPALYRPNGTFSLKPPSLGSHNLLVISILAN